MPGVNVVAGAVLLVIGLTAVPFAASIPLLFIGGMLVGTGLVVRR